MEKRSITLNGHRTSVALEAAFWRVLEQAAASRGLSLPKLIATIDDARARETAPSGLASALRVFVLAEVAGDQKL